MGNDRVIDETADRIRVVRIRDQSLSAAQATLLTRPIGDLLAKPAKPAPSLCRELEPPFFYA